MSSMMARNPWFRASFYAWSLGLEASSLIALRTLKIALGGSAAEAETHGMVGEARGRPDCTGAGIDRRAWPQAELFHPPHCP